MSLMLVAATMAAGLAIRNLPLGLPPFVVKHAGSVLWALMVYGIVSTIARQWPPVRCGIAATVVTSAVELSQLLHLPALDAVRRTGMGALLLGRVFSPWDLLSYAGAIWLGVAINVIQIGRNRL